MRVASADLKIMLLVELARVLIPWTEIFPVMLLFVRVASVTPPLVSIFPSRPPSLKVRIVLCPLTLPGVSPRSLVMLPITFLPNSPMKVELFCRLRLPLPLPDWIRISPLKAKSPVALERLRWNSLVLSAPPPKCTKSLGSSMDLVPASRTMICLALLPPEVML